MRRKRDVGYCKSMPGAVRPFERLRSQLRPARIDGVDTPEKSSVTSAAASEPRTRPMALGRRADLCLGEPIPPIAHSLREACRYSRSASCLGVHFDLLEVLNWLGRTLPEPLNKVAML